MANVCNPCRRSALRVPAPSFLAQPVPHESTTTTKAHRRGQQASVHGQRDRGPHPHRVARARGRTQPRRNRAHADGIRRHGPLKENRRLRLPHPFHKARPRRHAPLRAGVGRVPGQQRRRHAPSRSGIHQPDARRGPPPGIHPPRRPSARAALRDLHGPGRLARGGRHRADGGASARGGAGGRAAPAAGVYCGGHRRRGVVAGRTGQQPLPGRGPPGSLP